MMRQLLILAASRLAQEAEAERLAELVAEGEGAQAEVMVASSSTTGSDAGDDGNGAES